MIYHRWCESLKAPSLWLVGAERRLAGGRVAHGAQEEPESETVSDDFGLKEATRSGVHSNLSLELLLAVARSKGCMYEASFGKF